MNWTVCMTGLGDPKHSRDIGRREEASPRSPSISGRNQPPHQQDLFQGSASTVTYKCTLSHLPSEVLSSTGWHLL